MANLQSISSASRLRAIASSARARLANIREAAEEAAIRTTIVGSSVVGGGLTGFVIGRAERDNKDITIGDSDIKWTLPINGGLAVIGALFPRLVGDAAANALLGLGAGGLGFEAGMWGYKRGLAPPKP